ncbi:ribonuclease HII family protein, partial [Chlamydia psittaci 84-8471/1]
LHLPHKIPCKKIIQGDSKSASIAAASIIAKEYRDDLMRELHQLYPNYGFDKHKGYGTAAHLAALKAFGPCDCHRKSFAPVRQVF